MLEGSKNRDLVNRPIPSTLADTEDSGKSDVGESANTTMLYSDQQVSTNWGHHHQKHTSVSSEQGHQEDQLDLSASPERKMGNAAGPPLSIILDEIESAEPREHINKLEHTSKDEEKSQDLVLISSPIHSKVLGPIKNKLGQDTTNSKKKQFDYRAHRKSTSDAGPVRETMSAVPDVTKREGDVMICGWKVTKDTRWVVLAILLLLVSTIIPYYLL